MAFGIGSPMRTGGSPVACAGVLHAETNARAERPSVAFNSPLVMVPPPCSISNMGAMPIPPKSRRSRNRGVAVQNRPEASDLYSTTSSPFPIAALHSCAERLVYSVIIVKSSRLAVEADGCDSGEPGAIPPTMPPISENDQRTLFGTPLRPIKTSGPVPPRLETRRKVFPAIACWDASTTTAISTRVRGRELRKRSRGEICEGWPESVTTRSMPRKIFIVSTVRHRSGDYWVHGRRLTEKREM